MSEFFEILKSLPDPKVIFSDKNGVPLIALTEAGLEDFGSPIFPSTAIFVGEDKLLWDEIDGLYILSARLGRLHMFMVKFSNLERILQRLPSVKAGRFEVRIGSWRKGFALQFELITDIRVEGTAMCMPLEGLLFNKKLSALEQSLGRFKDFDIPVVDERVLASDVSGFDSNQIPWAS